MKILFRSAVILLLVLASGYFVVSRPQDTIEAMANPEGVNNLHLVDSDPATGFAIYRLGEPDADDIRGLCELGVSEIAVLAGTALDHEIEHQAQRSLAASPCTWSTTSRRYSSRSLHWKSTFGACRAARANSAW